MINSRFIFVIYNKCNKISLSEGTVHSSEAKKNFWKTCRSIDKGLWDNYDMLYSIDRQTISFRQRCFKSSLSCVQMFMPRVNQIDYEDVN